MTNLPPNPQDSENLTEAESQQLLQKLRQKQGNWVEWGKEIAKLQKSGYSPQIIFEATGFEPIQQNQVIVGAQVYHSIVKANASEAVRSHYWQRGSDILYELRMLTQEERATAAELTHHHQLDMDSAREIARAIKDFSRLPKLPAGFSQHPGDAVAYQCWKLARQKSDLQERSRLIAKGLKFAASDSARKQVEQLLTDFTVVPKKPAPHLPLYRPESESDLPRLVAVVGELPLSPSELQAVPSFKEEGVFGIVKSSGEQTWVALPGWQVILNSQDPVVIICNSDILPTDTQTSPESVLVVIDRAQTEWDANSYFAVENSTGENSQIDFQWFETQPEVSILGRIVVIIRPKRILDEEITKDAWQIDE